MVNHRKCPSAGRQRRGLLLLQSNKNHVGQQAPGSATGSRREVLLEDGMDEAQLQEERARKEGRRAGPALCLEALRRQGHTAPMAIRQCVPEPRELDGRYGSGQTGGQRREMISKDIR